ncbi:MAG: hypothetical protein JNJ73_17030 [Hyphomonadaceae bacterium]|nr:hypothetical protein [Hyphomonadaceae bacterium]
MTLGGRLVAWFPTAMIVLNFIVLGYFVTSPSIWTALLLVATLYLPPPIAFRIHDRFHPLKEGLTRLDAPDYSPWWAAHQFQLFYEAAPPLEYALRLVPGLYSMWLRLWGARVGYGVYWTPRVEIVDRPLMLIGNRVIFGHKVECYAHVTRRRAGQMHLLVKKVRIGNDCFIGAGSRLGPGATLSDGTILPALSDVHINETVQAPGEPDT